MITRRGGNLALRKDPAPDASLALERDGCVVLRGVFAAAEVAALADEINAVFEATDPTRTHDANNEFRHAMLNVSPLSQAAIGHPAILAAIEPLLGEDCHVIANTAWRNIKGHTGGGWHIDAGPHIPRPAGVDWPDAIPYPIFALGAHIYLEDCPLEAGPTAVLTGSHRSGAMPPKDRLFDLDLTYDGKPAQFLTAQAGDVALFVSDVWHRGTPAEPGQRRFFLQAHYGRRDIAQRLQPTAAVNHLSSEAIARADTDRTKTLVGLHTPYFYDG
jgi:ectoine hydroxylase-related dioxygenase (phytanoyl-CoA dioxygenase family)